MTLDIDFVRITSDAVEYWFPKGKIITVVRPIWFAQDHTTGREYYVTEVDECVVIPPTWLAKVNLRENPRSEEEVYRDLDINLVGSARKDSER